jgi:6-phosphofructokinase 1
MDMNLKNRFSELGLDDEQCELIDRNLDIPRIGDAHFDSPLKFSVGGKQDEGMFVPENERVLAILDRTIVDEFYRTLITPPSFEKAGPRKKLYFHPGETVSAVVTCGGLCPGLNAVVRSIVMMNYYRYGNQRTYGIRYGYAGLVKKSGYDVPLLALKNVDGIHAVGGSILGSSRGPQVPTEMVDRLEELGVNVLYTIGGDGTQRGALDIIKEIEKRNLKISVVGIPKTIDNDIMHIDKSFGMETAFSKACDAIYSAHTEAEASLNGIGIVKLMGRESGFIAANATLATNEVNFCLVPEVDFDLDGPSGLLAQLEERFHSKKHAVIVVAEGAGQKFAANPGLAEKDASGNSKLGDIGLYLQKAIKKYFTEKKVECSIKYIDPSYIIRSVAPTPNDSIFCAQLAQMAVHAGMSGRSNLLIGYTNGQFVHLPIDLCTSRRKKIDPHAQLWLSVLEATGQPASMKNNA